MQPHARPPTEPAQDVIHELASRTGRPVEVVRTVYEEQLALLGSDAKVTVYLPVLAKRRTREVLSRRR